MKRASLQRVLASLTLAFGLLASPALPAFAVDNPDDAGLFNSITVTRLAREALKAANRGDWAAALSNYNKALNQGVDSPNLYYGQYKAAARANDWASACAALDNLFAKVPEDKPHLLTEYGQALANNNRYEEAIPVLKSALKTVDADASYLDNKFRELVDYTNKEAPKRDIVMQPYREVTKQEVIPQRELIHAEDVREDKSKFALSFENAFESEFIGICTYQGYEKESTTTFFRPPSAKFHIDEILKGPPLNKDILIRFEFHDKTGTPAIPDGWKFGPDKMPKVGSKWIIFIKNAVPINGYFETFHGCYGRQEANEDNLNKIYAIIEAHRGQQ